jgi:hypothetical protein
MQVYWLQLLVGIILSWTISEDDISSMFFFIVTEYLKVDNSHHVDLCTQDCLAL